MLSKYNYPYIIRLTFYRETVIIMGISHLFINALTTWGLNCGCRLFMQRLVEIGITLEGIHEHSCSYICDGVNNFNCICERKMWGMKNDIWWGLSDVPSTRQWLNACSFEALIIVIITSLNNFGNKTDSHHVLRGNVIWYTRYKQKITMRFRFV